MKTAGPRQNYRVVVEPDIRFNWRRTGESQKDYDKRISDLARIAADNIAAAIRRHVDGYGSIYVESDSNPLCSHCGATWTEGDDPFNGGCCDGDLAEEDARIAGATVAVTAAQGEKHDL